MKLISLVKIFSAGVVLTGGISAVVAFTGFNTVDAPYVKVLTKNNYLGIKEIQKAQNVQNVNINYATLPTANNNLVDVLTTSNLPSRSFILSLGSYAYANTNKLLHGNETINVPDLENNNSIMLKLYEEFFNDKWNDLNMQFYSYVDVINTKAYFDAAALLHARKQIGDIPRKDPNDLLASTRWNVLNEDGNLDVGERNLVDVVLNGETFNYNPDPTTYYEWRADNKHDTEYEKVYFRNDDATKTFVNATTWASKYATDVLNTSISKEGTLLCAKFDDETSQWSFKAFTALSDFTTRDDKTLTSIIEFYGDDQTA